MNFFNFIVWLTAGAVIGWVAHRMVTEQQKRWPVKLSSSEEDRTEIN